MLKILFFELGGHSLKVMSLISECYNVFKIKLSFEEIFVNATLELQAQLISKSKEVEYLPINLVKKSLNYPVSSSQYRLWVLSQFEGGSTAYNIPKKIFLRGDYDIESFKRAIYSVIDRHEILRTILKKDDEGEVRQWILDRENINFEIKEIDFRSNLDLKLSISQYIENDSYKEFDLELGPLFRMSLLRISESDYVFYYNMHHIISDGWSMDVLYKDVSEYYIHYKTGALLNLSPLKIQYKDYTSWQLSSLSTSNYQVHQDYWIGKLKGELPVIDLPSSKVRPVVKTYRGRRLSTYLTKKQVKGLKRMNQSHKGTLFMSLVTVLKILLFRYTGLKDLIIGTSVSGRNHSDLENQIGFYLNTLILRNTIKAEFSFEDIYKEIRLNILESYEHQEYPFDHLVEKLNLNRDTSRNAVYDISLVLQNFGDKHSTVTLGSDELSKIYDHGIGASKNDIEFTFEELGDYIHMSLRYNIDVYEKSMMESFILHYKNLLSKVLEFPKIEISKQDYLLDKEVGLIRKGFNSTYYEFSKDTTLISLFLSQVDKTPAAIAILVEGREITYKELDELSNEFSRSLISSNEIVSETMIGVSLDKSEWVIISFLGILKIGGVYVPIDPNYPSSRKEFILKDSGINILVTESSYMFDIDFYQGSIYAVDIEFEQGKFPSTTIENISITSRSLAYVIYTSGSTGVPKGVMIEHGGICNTVLDHIHRFELTDQDRVLQFLSLSFDGSVLDIFMAILSGAGLSIPTRDISGEVSKMVDFIEKTNVSIVTLPPSYLRFLEKSVLPSVRLMVSAGEAIDVELALFYSKNKRFFNGYGPTEASVNTTLYELDYIRDQGNSIPIGKPSRNKQVLILDDWNNICPIGVLGEICISGNGLARGYLNRSDLTSDKFISHPFKKGEKMYRTGDIGKWLPDGNILFIGRQDDQVKIRGYRIELGEIENVLLRYNGIEEVVVQVSKESAKEDKHLVAFFVSSTVQEVGDLRKYLNTHLPNYMIPSYFVQLEFFPLTPNGKVDRKGLPNPKEEELFNMEKYVAPINKIEREIVKIWSEILNLDEGIISMNVSFFEIGGHSLKAITLVNKINHKYDMEFTLVDIFNNSQINSLSDYIITSKQIEIEKSDDNIDVTI